MKLFTFIITLSLCSFSFAGDGHDHSHGHGHSHAQGHSHGHVEKITAKKAQTIGKTHVERLIKGKKINQSWSKATFDKSIKKTFSGKQEWVVSFNNVKGIKMPKRLLDLTMSLYVPTKE